MLVGTLSYMSPEQIQTPRCADHRTDIYALGIILFFMATGRYPFGGEGYNLLFQHISGELPRLRDVSAQADVRLEPIIRKAMAKNPEDLYDNCREFALDLRQVIGSDVAFLSALVSFKSGMPLTTSAKEKAEPVIESKHTPNAALLTTDMLDLHYAKQLQTTVDNPSPLARNTPIPSFIDGSNNAENTPDVPHFGPYLGRSSRRLTLVILAMIIVAGLGLLIYQSGTDRPPSVTVDHADSAESLPPTSISPPVPDSPVPNTKKSQQASLHPDTKTAPNFTLYLNSKPSAADVFVNGQRHGTTPLHISAPQGKKLHIRLSKQGYLTEEFFWLSQSSENKSIRMIYDL
jgi:serine/threonine protein kinase